MVAIIFSPTDVMPIEPNKYFIVYIQPYSLSIHLFLLESKRKVAYKNY